MAHAWHFVWNSLKFHLFYAISECSNSNMSKSKVIYGWCMTFCLKKSKICTYFMQISECFDSNMSKCKVIYGSCMTFCLK